MKYRSRTSAGWSRMALGVLVTLVGGGAWGQVETRPEVGTRFEVVARDFAENLGAKRKGFEAEMAEVVAEPCREALSYLGWRALTNAPSAGDPPWVLRVAMVAEGSGPIPAAVLRFEKVVAGRPGLVLFRETLYAANDLDQPTQDAVRLRDDVVGRLRGVLENEANLAKLHGRFLVGIPIARRLDPDPERKRVFLAARWEDWLPGTGSLLSAQFQAQRGTGDVVPVSMVLSPAAGWKGRIGCTVTKFEFPPAPPVERPAWEAGIPESLSNAVPDSVQVFMEQYVKDYRFGTTTNRLVVQPFAAVAEGGGR